MALPNGALMTAGAGARAPASELIAIRGARGSQDFRTSRDYVPAKPASPADRVTNLLIAGRAEAGCPLNYAIGSGWRVSQVVRQRSAKPPPRVRIPHSPPNPEYGSVELMSGPSPKARPRLAAVYDARRSPPSSGFRASNGRRNCEGRKFTNAAGSGLNGAPRPVATAFSPAGDVQSPPCPGL